MTNGSRNALIYEINAWVWLREWSVAAGRPLTLAQIPAEAWDALAGLGLDAVWLMGIWKRSPAAIALALRNRALLAALRETVPDLRPEDVIGSPYAIHRYEVDAHFGGPAGLAAARQALATRGIRLILDFVPNHIAPDHPWVTSHPEWMVQGSRADLRQDRNAFMAVGRRVFARGRDPFFPPWSDVLQLNAFNAGQRHAAILELRKIAEQCDGVRCDMAMLLMNDVFACTWGTRAGAAPAEEYWVEVIAALRSSHPEFQFVAEAYWGREAALLAQGFDASYDKGLYDQMAHGSAHSIRNHLAQHSGWNDRLVRFLENHDEPRAAHVFKGRKGAAAAVALMTLPGIRLLHDGQLEGRKVKAPVHLRRRPEESAQTDVHRLYSRLSRLHSQGVGRNGTWSLCDVLGDPGGPPSQHLLCWRWQNECEQVLAIINYSQARARGTLRIPWGLGGGEPRFSDLLPVEEGNAIAVTAGPELIVDFQPWGFRLLQTAGVQPGRTPL